MPPRRPRGTGSLVKRIYPGGVRWRAKFGGRVRNFERAADAREWLKQQITGTPLPLHRRPAGLATFKDASRLVLARWGAHSDRVRTVRTLQGYRQAMEAFLDDWATVAIERAKPSDIDDYVRGLREAGLSTSTIRHRLDCLAQCIRAAREADWIVREPVRPKRPPLARKSTREAAEDGEVAALIEAAAELGPPYLALILLAADAGLRRGEIARIAAEDVDSVAGLIRIEVRGEADRPKSGRARVVPILTARLAVALLRGLPLPWTSADGVDKAARRIWEAAGLGTVSDLHRLRHRWVSRLLDGGAPPHQVAEWAGHKDLVTTMRYAHPQGIIPPGVEAALVGAENDQDPLGTQSGQKDKQVLKFEARKRKDSNS